MLNISRACLNCHPQPEAEMQARGEIIQDRTRKLLDRGEAALLQLFDDVKKAKDRGVTEHALAPVLSLQRKAKGRLDIVAAENSIGFHAPHAQLIAQASRQARL